MPDNQIAVRVAFANRDITTAAIAVKTVTAVPIAPITVAVAIAAIGPNANIQLSELDLRVRHGRGAGERRNRDQTNRDGQKCGKVPHLSLLEPPEGDNCCDGDSFRPLRRLSDAARELR